MKQYSFRRFCASDAKELYEALKDKKVVRHMASSGITLEVCEKIIRGANEHWENYHIGSWAVVDSATQKIIGWAGFKHIGASEFELLVVLSPSHWGMGQLIVKELIKQAKDEYHLDKLYVLLPETRKSFRFIQKLGFVYDRKMQYAGQPFLRFVKVLDGAVRQ